MRHLRPILAILAMAAILVACSSASPGASAGNQQSQGAEASGGGGGGGGASDGGGGASDGGGGGGGGGGGLFGDGSADYQVTGGVNDEGELAFIPAASAFNQSGVYNLSFYSEDQEKLLLIILTDDGNTLSWTNSEATMAGTQCDWNVTTKDDNNVEGSFTCNNQPFFTTEGLSGSANISGSFDAHR